VLTSLERFEFESPQSFPDWESQHPFPPTRSVLPALTTFWFTGTKEYLEDFVARIDTPRLHQSNVKLFNDIDFNTPELIRFVSRSSTLMAPIEAQVIFGSHSAFVKLQPQATNISIKFFGVHILGGEQNRQLSFVARICTTSSPLLSTTENLIIYERVDPQLDWSLWGDGIENIEWLEELLLPFTAVQNLYLSKRIAPRIVAALQEIIGGGTTGVLSTLKNIYVEGFQPSGPVQEGIAQFVSARQLTNHPVAISVWNKCDAR
jgi:hypothetical protein